MGQFPDAPTISESGLPSFEFNSWYAMMAPAGTPKPIVQRFYKEILKALSDDSVKEQLIAQGLSPRGTSPEELTQLLSLQLTKYEKLIRQAGISAD